MNNHIQWALRREHQGCSAPIPVPSPIHTGRVADLEGLPRGTRRAAFLCSICGLVTFYSDADLAERVLGTPDPYLQKLLGLGYIDVECVESSCGLRTPIHVVWDAAKSTLVTTIPMSDWRFDKSVKCERGHAVRLQLGPGEALTVHNAQMPF